jgi:hypothetical protein
MKTEPPRCIHIYPLAWAGLPRGRRAVAVSIALGSLLRVTMSSDQSRSTGGLDGCLVRRDQLRPEHG